MCRVFEDWRASAIINSLSGLRFACRVLQQVCTAIRRTAQMSTSRCASPVCLAAFRFSAQRLTLGESDKDVARELQAVAEVRFRCGESQLLVVLLVRLKTRGGWA